LSEGSKQTPVVHPSVYPFTIAIDLRTDVIRVVGTGFWTVQDVDNHFQKLGEIVRSVRRSKKQVRVMVDLRGSAVQAPIVIDRIGPMTSATYMENDRVAIVVGSSLAKSQMRRIIRRTHHEFFMSPDAALTWLNAYSG
jgi:hypothetical protein